MNMVTIGKLNRLVAEWHRRNENAQKKRGRGIDPHIKAPGGRFLASMATLLDKSIETIPVDGVPRPAVRYRDIWFVSYGKDL